MSADAGAIVSAILEEAIASTISDADLYEGIEDARTVALLKAKVSNGSLDRQTLARAAEMRRANAFARPPRRKPSQVYFIGAELTGLIKIGCASDPQARLRTLQTGSPDRLSLIATVPGDESVERDLHRQFAADRAHGEWFRQSASMVRFIEGLLP